MTPAFQLKISIKETTSSTPPQKATHDQSQQAHKPRYESPNTSTNTPAMSTSNSPPRQSAQYYEYTPPHISSSKLSLPAPAQTPSSTPHQPPPTSSSPTRLAFRPTSSLYSAYSQPPSQSEYTLPHPGLRRRDHAPQLPSIPQYTPTASPRHSPDWRPPVVRGRDAPFPAPIGRQYPVIPPRQSLTPPTLPEPPIVGLPPLPDIRPPVQRTERGRGIVRLDTTGGDLRRRADMYFDQELLEWRSIPRSTQMGAPEESWMGKAEGEAEGKNLPKPKRLNKLKMLGKELMQAVRGTASPQSQEEKDEERRAKLAASISAPLGTERHSRRGRRDRH